MRSIDLADLDGSNGFRLDGVNGSQSGVAVSAAGDVNNDGFADVVVGAYLAAPNGSQSGSSYVFYGAFSGFAASYDLAEPVSGGDAASQLFNGGFRFDGVLEGDQSGYSVSDAGDVNGDGIDDLIIGAHEASSNGGRSGSSYVLFGQAGGFADGFNLSGLDGSNGFRLDGASTGDNAGFSVSGGSDLNGDGLDDLIVGAYGSGGSGAAYVVFGSDQGFAPTLALSSLNGGDGFRLDGESASDGAGVAVSSAGDINGDGIDDLIVGASGADPNASQSGAAYVVFGSSAGFPASLSLGSLNGTDGFRLNGIANGDAAGVAVSRAGDVNGDGIGDLLIGADGNISAYVVFGSAAGFNGVLELADLDGSNGFRVDGEADFDQFGLSVGAAGDFNGDGIDDLIIGAPYHDLTAPNAGASYVVFGRATGFGALLDVTVLEETHGVRIDGEGSQYQLGFFVDGAGDVNNDGYDDLIIGAPGADYNGAGSGSSYVVFGRSDEGRLGTVVISGEPGEDQVLTAANNLADSNGMGPVSYQWLADGEPIPAATAATLMLTQAEVGKRITVTASYQDGLGVTQSQTSVATTEVFNRNDLPTGSVMVYGGALIGRLLTASNSLVDEDGVGEFAYQWLADGSPIAGAASDTLLISPELGGKIITVTASYLDGQGTAESVSSTGVAIANPGAGFSVAMLDGINGFRLDAENVLDYGFDVSGAGDVNGDGYDDLIYGAFGAGPDGIRTGAAYVVFGQKEGFPAALDLADLDGSNGVRLEGVAENDSTGYRVSAAGDLNDDGYADVVIGATAAGFNGESSGAAYVVFGGAEGFPASIPLAGLDGSNGFRLVGENAGDNLGGDVGTAGDLNGDGIDDLIVGASWVSKGYVVFGTTAGFQAEFDLSSLDGSNGFRFLGGPNQNAAYSVGRAGDVNHDGLDDLIVGAYRTANNGNTSGSAYVIYGQTGGFPATLDLLSLDGDNGFRVDGEDAFDNLGYSVSSAGDINGDGIDDIIVGAYNAGDERIGPGRAYVLFGRAEGFAAVVDLAALDGTNGFRLDGVIPGDNLGIAVSAAGDFNNDGIDDLLVSARNADSDGSRAGSSYLVFGKADPFDAVISLRDLDGTDGFRIDGLTGFSLGNPASGAGDVNGDGFADIILSAPVSGLNGYFSGSSYVIFGGNLPFGRTIEGGPGADLLAGSSGSDELFGFGGSDTLEGGGGNDVLDGGESVDHALFQGNLGEFVLVRDAADLLLTGPVTEGNDRLIAMERLHFSNVSLAFDLDGSAGASIKLLGAVLGKPGAADTALRGIAIDIFDNADFTFEQVMDVALDVVLGSNRSNTAVVNLLWSNLVGGVTPQDLLDELVGALEVGTFSQVELAVAAAEHPINLDNIDLVGLVETGVEYLLV